MRKAFRACHSGSKSFGIPPLKQQDVVNIVGRWSGTLYNETQILGGELLDLFAFSSRANFWRRFLSIIDGIHKTRRLVFIGKQLVALSISFLATSGWFWPQIHRSILSSATVLDLELTQRWAPAQIRHTGVLWQ